jgi:hypothetical protein
MKKRNFADGGETEDMVVPENEENAKARLSARMSKDISVPEEEEPDRVFAAPNRFSPKPQDFKSAFAEARSAGSKTFEFNGKKYTTDLAKPTAPAAATTAKSDFQKMEKTPSKLKYQSLKDRAEEYAMKNKAVGTGMYGTKKSEPETRTPKRAMNLTDMVGLSSQYAKGGSVSSRADGIAQRGKTRGKIC